MVMYKPLGPKAGEAHRMGKVILGRAILPSYQRVAGRDLNSGKISNAGKSQLLEDGCNV